MTPTYTDSGLTLYLGDCLEVMPTLADASVDAVVTDPPYGLEFMGKEWDRLLHRERSDRDRRVGSTQVNSLREYPQAYVAGSAAQAWHERWAREAFRLLKPGGHLLAFGGTRTYHRLASAIEDAGFEIRDCLVWAYASGFPKSLDVGKAIDRAAGAEREVVTVEDRRNAFDGGDRQSVGHSNEYGSITSKGVVDRTAPATDDAKRWDGWGTALKPAWEPIVLARKPLQGTVAANVLRHGVGALNIDATRIGYASEADRPTQEEWNRAGSSGQPGANGFAGQFSAGMKSAYAEGKIPVPPGRWPANVVLTDPIFDGDTPGVVGGGMASPGTAAGVRGSSGFVDGYDGEYTVPYDDTGTYSRFFLIPKEARAGREPAVRGALPSQPGGTLAGGEFVSEGRTASKNGTAPRENVHPTVKPLELMRHLVRLVTPPGGTVLDCFLGSGTTALAAIREGFACIGIEREAEYMAITMARLHGTQTGIGL